MRNVESLLREIESEWPIQIEGGLAELVRLNGDEEIYAAAFWLLYCDHTVIGVPAFGANAESALEDEGPDTSYRWQPPEWRWEILKTVCDGMSPFYQRLSEAMAGASTAEWHAVIAANEHLIGRVARSVTRAVRSRTGGFREMCLPDKFLVFAVDVRADAAAYNRLLRLSVDEEILPTLNGILAFEG